MSRLGQRARGRWLLACWLLALAGPALADYKSSFDAGRVASERQEWARVQSNMRQALAERPNPSASTRINSFPYLPKFYLGLAAFSLQDCPAALGFLEDPETVTAMRGLKEADRQALMVRACRNRLAAAARAAQSVAGTSSAAVKPPPVSTAAVRPPPASTAAVRPPPVSTAPVRASTAPVGAVAASGNDAKRLAALRDRLGVIDFNTDRAAHLLNDPSMAANAAAWRQRIEAQSAQTRRIRGQIAGADRNRDGNALANLERDLAALNQSSLALANELAKAHEAARQAAQVARTAEAAELRKQRAQLAAELRPLLDAFFAGEYARVAAWKPAASFGGEPEAMAQALLLRAAARHAQFVLGGERDVALSDQAKADVLEARRLSVELKPSARAFSPRFLGFFASAR